jgi:hypothetical protein
MSLDPSQLPTPIVAQALGIPAGEETLAAGVRKILQFAKLDFDTAGKDGLLVCYPNGQPDGYIFFRWPGYYRVSGQLYAEPPQTQIVSLYLGLFDRGPNGDEVPEDPLYSANQFLPLGEHPALQFDRYVRVTEPRYCTLEAYYLTEDGNPPTHALVVGENYNVLKIEYMGALETGPLRDWTVAA